MSRRKWKNVIWIFDKILGLFDVYADAKTTTIYL